MSLKSIRLGDVAELRSGVGFPKKYQGKTDGEFPFAKVGDISAVARAGRRFLDSAANSLDLDELPLVKAKPFPPGSVLFAKIGEAISQNFRVIAKRPLLIDNNAMAAIPDSEYVSSNYLYHFLSSIDLYRYAQATTVPSLRKSELERIEIPLPPIEEQRRIAAILDAADALRAKRRQALAKLNTLTQAIFIDMFGDPVVNPKELPIARLGELGTWASGGTPSRSRTDFFGGQVPWFSSGELETLYVSESNETITEQALEESSAKPVPKGALLLGMYDTAALKSSITAVDASCNQAIAFSNIDETLSLTRYVYTAVQVGKPHYRRLQRGIRQKNLNLSMIRDISIPLPTMKS